MILCKLEFEEVILRISFEELDLTNYWEPWLVSIDNVVRKMEFKYGGMDVIEWGGLGISFEAFKDTVNDQFIFPPPRFVDVTLYHTIDTEENAVILLTAKGFYTSIDENNGNVFYDFYVEEEEDILLLETTDDIVITGSAPKSYEGEVVNIPRIVGTVIYQKPLRLEDYSGSPRYHTHYLTGTIGSGITIFDDGVNINANAVLGATGTSGENTFYLNYTAVGTVSISGSGTFTSGTNSLKNAIDTLWTARGGSATVNTSYFRSTSDNIGHWVDTQKSLRRYISELGASYGHLIRYRDGVFDGLKLEARGLGTNVEFKDIEILPSNYEENEGLVGIVRTSYVYRYAFGKEASDTEYPYVGVEETPIELSRDSSVFYEGTTTSEVLSQLIDSGGGFLSKPTDFYGGDLCRPGMYAKNVSLFAGQPFNWECSIVSTDSDTILLVDRDIFDSGDDYEIGYKSFSGTILNIPSFSIDVTDLNENLKHIISYMHSRRITIKVPMEDDQDLDYGDRISIVERQHYIKSVTIGYGKVVGKIYDFENEIIIYIVVGTAYTEEPRIPRVDFSLKSSCMGTWLMNSIDSTTEYDRSGKQENLTISEDSGGSISRLNSDLPDGFKGFYKEFNRDNSEYMSIADGNFTDISGANQELSMFIRFRITEDINANYYLINKSAASNAQFEVFIFSTGVVGCLLSNDGVTLRFALSKKIINTDSGWQTIGVVYNDTDIRIYINGILDSNGPDNPKAYTTGIYDGSADFVIGSYNKTGAYLNGYIYEVGIWNEAFSADEMSWLDAFGIKGDKGLYEKTMIADTQGFDYSSFSSCKGAWWMNETAGTEADRSGNSETLTCYSSDSDSTIDRGNTNLPDGFSGYYRTFGVTGDDEYMEQADGDSGLDIGGLGQEITVFIRFRYSYTGLFTTILLDRGDHDSGGFGQFSLGHTHIGIVEQLVFNLKYNGADNDSISATITGTDVADTEWHTLCGVYTGKKIKLYVDGVLRCSDNAGTVTVNNSEGPFIIGGFEGADIFEGDIYEVGVWDEAFDKNKILDIHRFGIKGNQGASE